MRSDASIVDDDTPGATSMDQLRHDASILPVYCLQDLVAYLSHTLGWLR
jgi:hypothetical protein